MINKVTWPHEVVYNCDDKRASYQDISVPQFVYGYMIVINTEEAGIKAKMYTHLNDLMSNAQLYGWKRTWNFHWVWLNQFEQGRCTWLDEEAKPQFCRSLIWHLARTSPSCPNISRTSRRTRQHRNQASYNAAAKPGTNRCKAFNEGKCDKQMTNASLQHICSYCLVAVKGAFPHSEDQCNRKKGG